MKTLTENEIQHISGGLNMTGYSLTSSQIFLGRAILAIPYIRPAAAAFSFGYKVVGPAINKYTPVQSWISKTYGY